WRDDGGYDAYLRQKYFAVEPVPDGKLRYAEVRGDLPAAIAARVAQRGWSLDDLQQLVHLFVLHFDACGTSRQCFKVLHDHRYLSVHFLLDVDGTIYQTLDLQEQAHHATIANAASVGVEIAHPGCWPAPDHPDLRRWYERDGRGWRMQFPGLGEPLLRTAGFVARPARPELVEGEIHGVRYWQFDFTREQYSALAHLLAALHRVFPRSGREPPRAAPGSARATRLSPAERAASAGVAGPSPVQDNKQDPGRALQWDRLLQDARALSDRER